MNYIIYENADTCIWYSENDGEIHIKKNKTISFKDFIREIDTLQDKTPEWKKETIKKFAYITGIFRDVA